VLDILTPFGPAIATPIRGATFYQATNPEAQDQERDAVIALAKLKAPDLAGVRKKVLGRQS
jgi:hypothetical protein